MKRGVRFQTAEALQLDDKQVHGHELLGSKAVLLETLLSCEALLFADRVTFYLCLLVDCLNLHEHL